MPTEMQEGQIYIYPCKFALQSRLPCVAVITLLSVVSSLAIFASSSRRIERNGVSSPASDPASRRNYLSSRPSVLSDWLQRAAQIGDNCDGGGGVVGRA